PCRVGGGVECARGRGAARLSCCPACGRPLSPRTATAARRAETRRRGPCSTDRQRAARRILASLMHTLSWPRQKRRRRAETRGGRAAPCQRAPAGPPTGPSVDFFASFSSSPSLSHCKSTFRILRGRSDLIQDLT